MIAFLKALLADLAKLRMPVTAAAAVTTGLALVEPFGITLGGDTTAKVTGALTALGVISAYLQDRLGGVVVQTNPATLNVPTEEVMGEIAKAYAAGAHDTRRHGTTLPADGVERVAAIQRERQPLGEPNVTRGDE